jgi:protein-arginine kinase activator protein McsA
MFEAMMAAAEKEEAEKQNVNTNEAQNDNEEFKNETNTTADTDDFVPKRIIKPMRRRDAKIAMKIACTGCTMQFKKMANTDMMICHNCVKIYDAVVYTVRRNRAKVEVFHD